jgi:DNA-binding response OmpR family regulator
LHPKLDETGLGEALVSEARRRIVVVVDEHVETRTIIHHALTAAGYSVEQAPDGLTGLKMACRIHPALVIMEHPAYVYGGRALIESIQANVEMEDVSIMILSSRGGRNDQWLEKHPCDAYLSKPFQVEELVNVVSILTDPDSVAPQPQDPQILSVRNLRRRSLQPLKPAAATGGPPATAPVSEVSPPPDAKP